MKQKKSKNKNRTNTINTRNKQTTTSAAYKLVKSDTKDYQKSSYDNRTDNKGNNGNKDMSMELGKEENNKSKTKTKDQSKDEPTLPKESTTATTATTATTSSPLLPAQSEVFDSSSDNAMSEMKQIADMEPGDATKVFSHVEEQQQLDPLTTSVDDNIIKRTIHENNLTTNPASAEPTLHERDRSSRMESQEEDVVLMQNVKPNISQDHKESEQQNQLGKSIRFHDELNKEYRSDSLNNDDENNNPFISGIKLWQAYNEIWFDAYSRYMKTWNNNFRTIC